MTTVPGVAADEPGEVDTTSRVPSAGVNYVGLTWPSVVLLVASVVGAFLLRDAFVAAHRTVGWVIACAVVALLVDPLVDALDRRVPRVLSVVIVLLGLLALVSAIGFGVASEALDSLAELRATAPDAAAELESKSTLAADIGLTERVQTFIDDLDASVRDDALSQAASTVPTYLVTGILMLFLLAFGRRYVDAFVGQFAPRRGRVIGAVLRQAGVRGRTYLLYAIANALVNGLVVMVTCWTLELPAGISLGACVAAMTVLPLIGVLVGGVPALLLAFGIDGWQTGAIVLTVLVGLQAFEVTVVRPFVDRRTVRVGPAVPIVVGLVGFELYGPGGAVYGIALAVIGSAAMDALGHLRGETSLSAAT